MKKGRIIGIIALVIIIIVVGFFALTNNKDSSNKDNSSQDGNNSLNQMFDCGKLENPVCFSNRMSECLPVTAQLIGTDDSIIDITILGIENGTCHFQRKVNNVVNLNCYFPRGTMNWDTIDQTFGNEKGLQKVVDDACKSGW